MEIALIVHAIGPNNETADSAGLTHGLKWYYSAGIQSVKAAIRRDPQTYMSLSAIDWLASAQRIQCTVKPADRLGVVIPAPVVEKIAETCDVVVHFQVGILQGDILMRPQ